MRNMEFYKHDQLFFLAMLLNQQERPPKKYSYQSSEIYCYRSKISFKLGYRAVNARKYVRCARTFYLDNEAIYRIKKYTTAVEQAVAWEPVTQRVRVQSPVGTGFLGEFFRGFSSPVKQMSGNFRPTRSPNILCPPQSSFNIRFVGMNECVPGVYRLSCLSCLGGGPGIELIPHPGRSSMSLCGQKSIMQSKD